MAIPQKPVDLIEKKNVIGLVKTLVEAGLPAVLSTVDQNGNPQLRWMSTLSFEEFPIFYSLAAPESRKVAQIKQHPNVNWMFSNHDLSLIVNLIGRARILEDTTTLKRIWKQIKDKSRTYFLDQYVKGPGFVVIETTVEVIECCSPENAQQFEIETTDIFNSC